MAYSAIANSEIDTDSPITTGLMTKYRDNIDAMKDGTGIDADAITNTHIATNAVNQDSIAAGSIHQGELDVSSEEDSHNSSGVTIIDTSAGQYALSHEIKTNGLMSPYASVGVHGDTFNNGAYAHRLTMNAAETSDTIYARTTYINASAPFDLGDGEIPLFIWVLMNGNLIEAVSTSPAPTWAYNGPTIIRPDRVAMINGKLRKFINRRTIDEDSGDIDITEIEIDHSIKNADIELFPHPFIANDLTGKTVVLIDPPETGYLSDLHFAQESINEMIHNDYLRIGNQPLSRAAPPGVIPSPYSWKNSRARAGEMIKDKRENKGPYSGGVDRGNRR